MRGHVRKRGAKYAVVVDTGRDPETGKRRQRWHSGYRTKREAESALSAILGRIEMNRLLAELPSEPDEKLR